MRSDLSRFFNLGLCSLMLFRNSYLEHVILLEPEYFEEFHEKNSAHLYCLQEK